jgi:hypothetical protein
MAALAADEDREKAAIRFRAASAVHWRSDTPKWEIGLPPVKPALPCAIAVAQQFKSKSTQRKNVIKTKTL